MTKKTFEHYTPQGKVKMTASEHYLLHKMEQKKENQQFTLGLLMAFLAFYLLGLYTGGLV